MDNSKISNIVDTYSDMIYRIAINNLKNQSDAEDIVQNIFVKLMNYKGEFENDDHEKAWIIKVTINMCRDFLKSAWFKKRTQIDKEYPYDENFCESDYKFSFLPAINKLPQKYRNVIYLHYYEDLSVKQISSILNTNENTVLSWLHRARKKLEPLLEEVLFDE